METKGNEISIAAIVLGIMGTALAFTPIINTFGIILGALGLIFGVVGLIKASGKAKAIVGITLSVAAIVISISIKAATVKAIDDAVKETSSSIDDAVGDNTDKLLKNDIDVVIGQFTIVKGEFLDDYKLPLTITNKGKENANFIVQIEAVDTEGKRIDDDTIYVNSLGAGQSQDFEAFTLITADEASQYQTATFKIVEISKF